MKSTEQMEQPEQPEEKTKRKITTPEEWNEITRLQRAALGLKEVYDSSSEQIEAVEKSIKKLLTELYKYNFNNFDPQIEEESIWIESEALSGNDRVVALSKLIQFLQYMKEEYGLPE